MTDEITFAAPAGTTASEVYRTKARDFAAILYLEGTGEPVAVALIFGEEIDLHPFCRRCHGSGRFSYNSLDGDLCYGCEGFGHEPRSIVLEDALRRAKARIARREREARKAREAMEAAARARVEGIVALQAAEPEIFEALAAAHGRVVVRDFVSYYGSLRFVEESWAWIAYEGRGLVEDVAVKWYATGRITEGQIEAVRKIVTAQAESAPVPTGRVVIEGEIRSMTWRDNDFGGAWKMLVVSAEGWKVWGTVPSALFDAEEVTALVYDEAGYFRSGEWGSVGAAAETVLPGRRCRFTATVKASDDDPAFGFYSRPAKAEILPAS